MLLGRQGLPGSDGAQVKREPGGIGRIGREEEGRREDGESDATKRENAYADLKNSVQRYSSEVQVLKEINCNSQNEQEQIAN